MKAVPIALGLVAFIAGCAGQQSPRASSDRPDLLHKSAIACEQAGRQWNGTSSTCMRSLRTSASMSHCRVPMVPRATGAAAPSSLASATAIKSLWTSEADVQCATVSHG